MFHAGTAVRNLAEIVASQFLLFLEAKRAVVGRDHLKIVHAESLPQFLLIRLVTKGRGHHVLFAFKAWALIVGVIEKQVLRAGFGVSRQAKVTSVLYLAQRIVAAEMDDVYRRVGHLGEGNRAMNSFGLRASGARQSVEFRCRFSLCQSAL